MKKIKKRSRKKSKLPKIGRIITFRPREPRGRYTNEKIWTSYNVEAIAHDPKLQHIVRRYTHALVGFQGPRPIRARIELSYPLTKQIPEKLKIREFTVRREGDLLICAAKMYRKIYAADKRAGGESSTARDQRLDREKRPLPMLLNRSAGPYIWGHDIGDLYFETMSVRWLTPDSCVVMFGVGS